MFLPLIVIASQTVDTQQQSLKHMRSWRNGRNGREEKTDFQTEDVEIPGEKSSNIRGRQKRHLERISAIVHHQQTVLAEADALCFLTGEPLGKNIGPLSGKAGMACSSEL